MLDVFLNHTTDPNARDWSIEHHERIPKRKARLADLPENMDPRVNELVRQAGVSRLYAHQAEAVKHCLDGRNTVLATSTASGKTLAFQIPVIHRLLQDDSARALFLFPLKALERDQRDAFLALAEPAGLTAAVYDGDTPEKERAKIRRDPPRVLITNPDMLHVGLLAYHDIWREFFGNLAYIVLDEVHTYKGIFGSHIAQLMRRVRRVCGLYRARPQFFASSATVANPGDFVSALIDDEVAVVDRSGAPASERHFLFLQPVLSPYTVATKLFIRALSVGLKTIVFTRARKITELITTWVLSEAPEFKNRISSYRAGFLPEERREIERQLFSGAMDGVISTSALEMGIDVGGLDLCILVGYPGTVINTWQRGGRVGRANRPSAIVLVAGNDALDQYFLRHPEDFFGRECERAIIDPLNREILKQHLPCAAAETPLLPSEPWTAIPEVRETLEGLEEADKLYRSESDGAWRSPRRRPQRDVNLRSIGEAYSIFLENGKTMVGSSSGVKAFTECHEGAVYLHRTRTYVVRKLDLERRNVIVKPERVNYYTKALSEKDTEILGAPLDAREFPGYRVRLGRLKVTQWITSYEKRRTSGQDLIGVVELQLPPLDFETVGLWLEIPEKVHQDLKDRGLHFMGGIHALEHAAISVFPLFALCDRDDIGGISTPFHEQVAMPAVFIYDGHPGGVGLSQNMFEQVDELLEKTLALVKDCPCEQGCPSCIHSPKCGSGNKPLDKEACTEVLMWLLRPEQQEKKSAKRRRIPPKVKATAQTPSNSAGKTPTKRRNPIFPDAVPVEEPAHADSNSLSIRRKPTERNPEPPVLSPRTRKSPTVSPRVRTGRGAQRQDKALVETAEKPLTVRRDRIVVFDLETQRLAQDVGGWKNIAAMGISVGVAHSERTGFRTFTEKNIHELIAMLIESDLVVGFNHVRFDYELLQPFTSMDLRKLPNLDILTEVHKALGFRLKLDQLAAETLGTKKSGSGTDAVKWFREGRLDLIEEYCRQDVAITRDLFLHGVNSGRLLYRSRGNKVKSIPVDWRRYAGE